MAALIFTQPQTKQKIIKISPSGSQANCLTGDEILWKSLSVVEDDKHCRYGHIVRDTVKSKRYVAGVLERGRLHGVAPFGEVSSQDLGHEYELVPGLVRWGILVADGQHRVDGKVHTLTVGGGCEEKKCTMSEVHKREKERQIDKEKKKRTVFSTEAPVKSVDEDLFHAVLARAVIEGPLHLLASGALHHAGFLQLVLVVQQSVHELLHLQDVSPLAQWTPEFNTQAQDVALSPFQHLYDPDCVVVIKYGLVEALHHALELVRVLVDVGHLRQAGQRRALLWKRMWDLFTD